MAAAAGRQHNGAGANPVEQRAIKNLHPTAAPVLNPELTHPDATSMQQSLPLLDPFPEHIHEGSSRLVLNMQHAVVAVGRFEGGGEAAITVAIEGHAHIQQALNAAGRFLHQQAHRIAVAETCPGLHGVLRMTSCTVTGTGHGSDAALGPAAGGIAACVAIEQQNVESVREFQAGHQPGGPRANDNHIPGASGNALAVERTWCHRCSKKTADMAGGSFRGLAVARGFRQPPQRY